MTVRAVAGKTATAIYAVKQEVREMNEDKGKVELDVNFKAAPDFEFSQERWDRDALTRWQSVSDEELIANYQNYLEVYCWGCKLLNYTPSIKGFRVYLMTHDHRSRILERYLQEREQSSS